MQNKARLELADYEAVSTRYTLPVIEPLVLFVSLHYKQ